MCTVGIKCGQTMLCAWRNAPSQIIFLIIWIINAHKKKIKKINQNRTYMLRGTLLIHLLTEIFAVKVNPPWHPPEPLEGPLCFWSQTHLSQCEQCLFVVSIWGCAPRLLNLQITLWASWGLHQALPGFTCPVELTPCPGPGTACPSVTDPRWDLLSSFALDPASFSPAANGALPTALGSCTECVFGFLFSSGQRFLDLGRNSKPKQHHRQRSLEWSMEGNRVECKQEISLMCMYVEDFQI